MAETLGIFWRFIILGTILLLMGIIYPIISLLSGYEDPSLFYIILGYILIIGGAGFYFRKKKGIENLRAGTKLEIPYKDKEEMKEEYIYPLIIILGIILLSYSFYMLDKTYYLECNYIIYIILGFIFSIIGGLGILEKKEIVNFSAVSKKIENFAASRKSEIPYKDKEEENKKKRLSNINSPFLLEKYIFHISVIFGIIILIVRIVNMLYFYMFYFYTPLSFLETLGHLFLIIGILGLYHQKRFKFSSS